LAPDESGRVPLCPEVPGLRERETGAASSSGQNGLSPRNHQAVADDHCRPVWSSSPEHERSRIRFSNYGLLQQVSHIRASPLPNRTKNHWEESRLSGFLDKLRSNTLLQFSLHSPKQPHGTGEPNDEVPHHLVHRARSEEMGQQSGSRRVRT
jgi:hypothetical protein